MRRGHERSSWTSSSSMTKSCDERPRQQIAGKNAKGASLTKEEKQDIFNAVENLLSETSPYLDECSTTYLDDSSTFWGIHRARKEREREREREELTTIRVG